MGHHALEDVSIELIDKLSHDFFFNQTRSNREQIKNDDLYVVLFADLRGPFGFAWCCGVPLLNCIFKFVNTSVIHVQRPFTLMKASKFGGTIAEKCLVYIHL